MKILISIILIWGFVISPRPTELYQQAPQEGVQGVLESRLWGLPHPDGPYYIEVASVHVRNANTYATTGAMFRLTFDKEVRILHSSIFCEDEMYRNMLQSKIYYQLLEGKMYQVSLEDLPPGASVVCRISFHYPAIPRVENKYITGSLYHNGTRLQSLGPEQLDGYVQHPWP